MAGTLSIVVTVVGGGECLGEFLRSLTRLTDAPDLDVIIPHDASLCADGLAREFPEFRFLNLGTIPTARPADSEAGRHERYDRCRAAGLAAATGSVVAILEDRGQPRPDWAATAMRLHDTLPNGVIGGAIDCHPASGLLNWAVWVTDLGRYGRPLDAGPVRWVSDVNITYKRAAIEATRALWKDRYHEPVVNWHLLAGGDPLVLTDELVVTHRRPKAHLAELIPERFHWGRLFGSMRGQRLPLAARLGYVLASPVIPPLLWVRHGLRQRRKGSGARYVAALPYVMLLTTVWTIGESWGTLTGKP